MVRASGPREQPLPVHRPSSSPTSAVQTDSSWQVPRKAGGGSGRSDRSGGAGLATPRWPQIHTSSCRLWRGAESLAGDSRGRDLTLKITLSHLSAPSVTGPHPGQLCTDWTQRKLTGLAAHLRCGQHERSCASLCTTMPLGATGGTESWQTPLACSLCLSALSLFSLSQSLAFHRISFISTFPLSQRSLS